MNEKNKPSLDTNYLESNFKGDEDILVDAFIIFKQNKASQLENLNTAMTNQSTEELFHAAHKIKGSALNLGAVALADIASQIESIASKGDLATATTLCASIPQEFSKFESLMQEYLIPFDLEHQLAG